MYFNNTSWLFSKLYPSLTWSKRGEGKNLYLTFDDGPVPEITEWVLETLQSFKAKASFFCVGDNARKYPEILEKMISQGHTVGNHTFNHLNGWRTEDEIYLENIVKCENVLEEILGNNSEFRKQREVLVDQNNIQKKLFRPPYGKIKVSQIRQLRRDYRIIMWDVLTGDYDQNLKEENCLKKAIKYSDNGSIVIFHDSLKAQRNMKFVLPRYLEHFSALGYNFQTL